MPQIPNPYFAGPPANKPNIFYGRQDVLRFVEETLVSPMHNVIVLYGQRRIGKTSVLHQISHRFNENYEAVFFDMHSSVTGPAQNLLYGLAREIAYKLQLPTPNRANFQDDPDVFRTNFLPQVYQQLGEKRLLLLMDEFDALSLEAAPTELDTLPLVKTLNQIIQSDNKQIVFLFVVGRRLKDLTSIQLQIFRGARDRQIGLLQKEATLDLITGLGRDILTYQDTALERVWDLTNGHPYFTQLLCYEIFNHAQREDNWTVTATNVDYVIDDAINAGQSALQWFWDEVPSLERFTLYTIGQLTIDGIGITLDQLVEQRNLQSIHVPDIELRALPDILVDRQVLKRDAEDRYWVAVELVRRWVINTHSLEEVTNELRRGVVEEPARAFFEAGRAAYNDDVEFAIQSFTRALSINPDYVEARLWLARTKAKTGDLLSAIDEFAYVERFGGREAREARLGMADARAKYGQQLEDQNKIEEAKQEYQRVLELDAQHTLANTRLSEIFLHQAHEQLVNNGIEAARPFYEQAVKHSIEIKTERNIKEQLKKYSLEQAAIHNWHEAEQASHLSIILMSKAEDSDEGLLKVRLSRARWNIERHQLGNAAEVYHRILTQTDGDTVRQTIENDILRYSQQLEENNSWLEAEDTLKLLVELFPNDPENQGRLTDSLCRQAEYYLNQNDLTKAKSTYQRVRRDDATSKTSEHVIRAGFQSYRRTKAEDNTLETRLLVEEAMKVLVTILGLDDAQSYQWLSEARQELADALLEEGRTAEAKTLYQQALDDLMHVIQFAPKKELAHYHKKQITLWFNLGQIELKEGRFDQAEDLFRQALAATPVAPPKMIGDIKTVFNNYRQQQEKELQWTQARRAIELLGHLFPDDEQVHVWLAETSVALADWHLQRGIPDPDEAHHLARGALEIHLPVEDQQRIIQLVKNSFKSRCEQQESSTPPNWEQAELILNKLVSLLPDDSEVSSWLTETRIKQGNWYLTPENGLPEDAGYNLYQAEQVYKRALNDASGDETLIKQIKNGFRAYQLRQQADIPPDLSLAQEAITILARLIPTDPDVREWQQELTKSPQKQQSWQRWAIFAAVIIVIVGCIGGITIFDTSSPSHTPTPAVVVVANDTPTDAITPVAPTPTLTYTPSPTAYTPTPVSPPTTSIPSPTPTVPTPTLTSTPTPTPSSSPIPLPFTNIIFECNRLSDSDELQPGETVELTIDGEGEFEVQWSYQTGNLTTTGAYTATYLPPITPGEYEVSAIITQGSQTQTLTCAYTVLLPTPTITPTPTPLLFKLAYIQTEGTDHSLYVVDLENLTVVGTPQPLVLKRAASPSWSPNGQYIAFLGEVEIEHVLPNSAGGSGIWRYNLKTNKPELLQEIDRMEYIAWSPDGKTIAYQSSKDTGKSRIFFMDKAWQNQPTQIPGQQPDWAPNSSRIIIKTCDNKEGCGLWSVDLDGLTPQKVTNHQSDSFPDWQNGKVVFTSERNGNWDIYVVSVNETGQSQGQVQQLTTDPSHDTTPIYSPDGKYIFFRSNRGGRWAIWVMYSDGTEPRELLPTGGNDTEWEREKLAIIQIVR